MAIHQMTSGRALAMSRLFEALRKLEADVQMLIAKDDPQAHDPGGSDPADQKTISLSPLFLVETLREIKKTVGSIYKITLASMEKPDNDEDRERFRLTMTKAYDQIISTVDMLSSYIHATSPIPKKNTIHCILEEILESNEEKLHARKVDFKKTLAEELPETTFHDEQVRFLLNLVLQYAILSTPSGGSIEIVTRFINDQKTEESPRLDQQKSKYSEISISSFAPPYSLNEPVRVGEVPEIQRDGTSQFILRLIKEMIQRNRGLIDFQVDRVKSGIRISLKFPVERRRVAYYRPVNL